MPHQVEGDFRYNNNSNKTNNIYVSIKYFEYIVQK